MNHALVEQVANAVLYEGYLLYPYRPSVKNRQRWTFGGLVPHSYSLAQEGSEPWTSQTECLVAGKPSTRVHVRVRFLQLVERRVGQFAHPLGERIEAERSACHYVERLQVGDQRIQAWQEAVERDIHLGEWDMKALGAHPRLTEFAFPARQEREPVRGPTGDFVGVIVREQEALSGAARVSVRLVENGLYQLTVTISNPTSFEDPSERSRDQALMRSLVSTHTILGVQDGEFVSMIDPPEPWREAAASCRNIGTWPVLVGTAGEKETLLSSPIILYDYPQIAPESPGDLFDSTEIDEILTLRIMTMTEQEKREMAAVDHRARALLERTESLAGEQLRGLHGAMRGLRPIAPEVADG